MTWSPSLEHERHQQHHPCLQVFSGVAERVVTSALEGINGTVFAYGSTGSGKTFTITGGMGRYEDRGIVPRAISHAFTCMAERAGHDYQARSHALPTHSTLSAHTAKLASWT